MTSQKNKRKLKEKRPAVQVAKYIDVHRLTSKIFLIFFNSR